MKKIRVLIVDDSALMRQMLTALLSKDPDIEVIRVAPDPYAAREKIKALNPDVLTLDVEMPKMDGLTFLEKLMRGHPMPVVVVSSLTEAGCQTTLRALELGAVDFITKPKLDLREGMEELAQDIIAKVKAAAVATVKRQASGER
jgi:two-component system chemotaxis response regulator CheB